MSGNYCLRNPQWSIIKQISAVAIDDRDFLRGRGEQKLKNVSEEPKTKKATGETSAAANCDKRNLHFRAKILPPCLGFPGLRLRFQVQTADLGPGTTGLGTGNQRHQQLGDAARALGQLRAYQLLLIKEKKAPLRPGNECKERKVRKFHFTSHLASRKK